MATQKKRSRGDHWELITCVVQRGKADAVFKQARESGAGGATIFFARGTGIRERLGLLGIAISPEKEVVTILSPSSKVEALVDTLVKAADLDTPGMGVLFVQPVHSVRGLPDLGSSRSRRSRS